jgi:hypothetical protein
MKKLLLLLTLMAFTACGGQKKIVVDSLTYEKNGDNYSYKIEIPQIKGIRNKEIEELNVELSELADSTIESMVNGLEGSPAEYIESYQTFENDFGITSILLETYSIGENDANGIQASESINIKNSNGSFVTFDSFFKEGAREYIINQIENIINKTSGKIVLNSNGEEVAFFEDVEINLNDSAMYFEGNDICFKFDMYELAPHSEGQPIIRFPK